MDEIKTFQVPATFNQVKTLGDGGLRIILDTPELSGEEMAFIMGCVGEKSFYATFTERPISKEV